MPDCLQRGVGQRQLLSLPAFCLCHANGAIADCTIRVALILGRFRHEYAGAMNFYLNYLKAEEKEKGEADPVGILLCLEKNETHVEYALGGMSNQIFVSRYLPHFPTEDELHAFLRQTRRRLRG